MTQTPSRPSAERHIEVAVPLPIDGALTYSLPADHSALPGCRVKVRVGKRLLTGVMLRQVDEAPEGVSVRAIERVVDPEPVLDRALLELAEFVADYYLAPIGEVVQGILPSDLEPWGDRRVWLTDAGALGSARNESEAAIIERLRDGGRVVLADLQGQVEVQEFARVVQDLAAAGKVAIAERRGGGSRFTTAIELRSGSLETLLERCGRSQPAREVVEYLAAVGRPSTVRETLSAIGCGRSVITRLVKLDVLRQFTQLSRLDLDRHVVERQEVDRFQLNQGQEQDRGVFARCRTRARGGARSDCAGSRDCAGASPGFYLAASSRRSTGDLALRPRPGGTAARVATDPSR
jgi:primosomal protein N'